MRFDSAASVEEIVWMMRLADEVRAEDRRIILRQFNGNPPFDESTAEENNIQINQNDLTGPNVISAARRQWNNAFLKPYRFFTARPDTGPSHKRATWSISASNEANRLLKRSPSMVGQVRATGAQTLLFGVGPTNWKNRTSIIPQSIPMGSLMIPSETEIDDLEESLSYFAVFREWTPAKLWDMTHGPRVDPGWNMDLVQSQIDYLKDQLYKSPTSLAYQYMPERIEELIKQDKGYFGTDAVPTCDVWDFYFREAEDGQGWYRRVLLDWNTGEDLSSYRKAGTKPESRNKVGKETKFLYTSGKRKYASSLSEIIHCNFGDCSPYAPFKYHSIRSLGWMLWGVCDLQNRLHCKFNEGVFEQLMWFFQTAGNQDLMRIKKANFEHLGVIPQGIRFLTANERFTPNPALIEMAFARNRQLIADSATSYTQSYDRGPEGRGRTATETMAIVNSSQALASGILETAYTYEAFKYREMFRRLCLKNSKDAMAQEFRKNCLRAGIPEDMLDADKWSIEPEQVLGGGNKTLQMATVGFLNSIRPNLPPAGQRIVDHLSVEYATDQPELAEEIAPMGQDRPASYSTNSAQLATERLLRGLPFTLPKDAVVEDYVVVWLSDLGLVVKQALQKGGLVTPEDLNGMNNLAMHIQELLSQVEQPLQSQHTNEAEKAKIQKLKEIFGQLLNHIKGLAQRLQQSMKANVGAPTDGNGAGDGKREAAIIMAETKSRIAENSALKRTAQKSVQFEREQKRKDIEFAAELERKGVAARHELIGNRLKALSE